MVSILFLRIFRWRDSENRQLRPHVPLRYSEDDDDELLIIYMKKFTAELNDLKGRTKNNILKICTGVTLELHCSEPIRIK